MMAERGAVSAIAGIPGPSLAVLPITLEANVCLFDAQDASTPALS